MTVTQAYFRGHVTTVYRQKQYGLLHKVWNVSSQVLVISATHHFAMLVLLYIYTLGSYYLPCRSQMLPVAVGSICLVTYLRKYATTGTSTNSYWEGLSSSAGRLVQYAQRQSLPPQTAKNMSRLIQLVILLCSHIIYSPYLTSRLCIGTPEPTWHQVIWSRGVLLRRSHTSGAVAESRLLISRFGVP